MWAADGRPGVTIAAIAIRLGMSKAGVFAPFGSKDALDLAAVEAAIESVGRDIVAPAGLAPAGVARLAALVEGWLGQVAGGRPAIRVLGDRVPRQPAALRARLLVWRESWQAALRQHLDDAIRLGELDRRTEARLVAFDIDALLMAALRGADADDPTAIPAARRAVESRLRRLATGD